MPDKANNCCRKCQRIEVVKDRLLTEGGGYPRAYCIFPDDCPCHHPTQENKNWEEEFEKYYAWTHGIGDGPVRLKAITDFIHSLLASQRESLLEEASKKVKDTGHQQEDGTIWCNMDEVLMILSRLSEKQ